MASTLYPKLAFTNLIKNKSTYFPYMLTSIVCVMTYYIMQSIAVNKGMMQVPGAAIALTIFLMGTVIIALFCIALMFYTNSFLIKRRKKELGLYCVLGMEKRHVAAVLFFETLYTAVICLALGLLFGVLFSKLLFLLLLKLLGFTSTLAFSVSVPTLATTAVLFLLIYGATLLYNFLHLRLAKPVELLRGGQTGEKEPRSSRLLALFGVLALGGGYFISQYYKNPLNALLLFFLAVFLVIIGTYCLFTSGSIVLLKFLRGRKNFYYKPGNFVAVSGMLYRMKQNAAGLASICILSTMVLVTISTTISLYVGREGMLKGMYPFDVNTQSGFAQEAQAIDGAFTACAQAAGLSVEDEISYRSLNASAVLSGGTFSSVTASESGDASLDVQFVPLEDYNRMHASALTLGENEALAYEMGQAHLPDELTLGSTKLRVVQRLTSLLPDGQTLYNDEAFDGCTLVVKDMATAHALATALSGRENLEFYFHAYNVQGTDAQKAALADAISAELKAGGQTARVVARATLRSEWNAMYGSFLFLGVFLGSLFLTATVLIIYYKQISEGYDDHDRFRIMQQVGMSGKEVRGTINKQILLVFFLPLCAAALHMVFAYEIICNILLVFGMTDRLLFLACTAGTFLAFAAAYILVYRITARSYYRLVAA